MDKELKLIIYKDMLWRIESGVIVGFCAAFELWLRSSSLPEMQEKERELQELYSTFSDLSATIKLEETMLKLLPELKLYKPFEVEVPYYWFKNIKKEENRIRILKEIIHKLNNET